MKAAALILALVLTPVVSASGQSGPAISEKGPANNPGAAVDSRGSTAIDPTENVKALSEAANKRQDDLRAALEKQIGIEASYDKTINELRYLHNKDLREAATSRIDAEMKLRAEYAMQLSIAEAKRIDAIRAVDVNAVSVASQRASDQATVLANQVAQSAEALRGLVATTANTVAQSQQQLANTLSARLTTLEQAGYQQAGQSKFQDPQLAALIAEVKTLSARAADTSSVGTGRGEVVAWVLSAVMLLIALVTSSVAVVTLVQRSHDRTIVARGSKSTSI